MKTQMQVSGSAKQLCWKFFWLRGVIALFCLFTAQSGSSTLVTQIDTSLWQMFLDDFVVARTTGLDRVVHHPRSRGLVIPADKPWETFGSYPQYVGRRQDGTFFAFYHAF